MNSEHAIVGLLNDFLQFNAMDFLRTLSRLYSMEEVAVRDSYITRVTAMLYGCSTEL